MSLRRQEIADRLNAWTIFNDKNKEFCDWLTQMENKVCHNGDLSIGEMVEKLKKVQRTFSSQSPHESDTLGRLVRVLVELHTGVIWLDLYCMYTHPVTYIMDVQYFIQSLHREHTVLCPTIVNQGMHTSSASLKPVYDPHALCCHRWWPGMEWLRSLLFHHNSCPFSA